MLTMNRIIVAATTAALAATLAGCSTTSGTASTPTPRTTVAVGMSAASIAKLITGCDDVHAVSVSGPMLSSATCTLDGHSVAINSWSSQADVDSVQALVKASSEEMYWAAGKTWTVTPNDDPTLQRQLTNDAGALMSNANQVPAQPDLDGQRTTANDVVKALGGDVVHVKAS